MGTSCRVLAGLRFEATKSQRSAGSALGLSASVGQYNIWLYRVRDCVIAGIAWPLLLGKSVAQSSVLPCPFESFRKLAGTLPFAPQIQKMYGFPTVTKTSFGRHARLRSRRAPLGTFERAGSDQRPRERPPPDEC